MQTLEAHYRKCRHAGVRAVNAIRAARHLLHREQTLGGTIGRTLQDRELVRVRVEPDWEATAEEMAGDMFDPKVCTHLSARELAAERKEYEHKVEQFGFVGLIAEIRADEASPWECVESCWGFDNWGDYLADEERDFLLIAVEAWMESGWELTD